MWTVAGFVLGAIIGGVVVGIVVYVGAMFAIAKGLNW